MGQSNSKVERRFWATRNSILRTINPAANFCSSEKPSPAKIFDVKKSPSKKIDKSLYEEEKTHSSKKKTSPSQV